MIRIKQELFISSILLLLIVSVVATYIHNRRSLGLSKAGTSFKMEAVPSSLSLKVYPLKNGGWAYDIYIDSTVYISQDIVPGVRGKVKFQSQAEAMTCGELIIKKMKNNESPFISNAELDSLEVTY